MLRETASKCGARRKQDGEPCQRPALPNGRCRLHGGLTPRGADWHRVQLPTTSVHKLEKKLRELDLRRKRRAARVAAMPPERRAKYEAQSQAAQPRSLVERENKRRAREAAKLLLSQPPPAAVDPELARLQAKMAELDVEEVRLKARLAAQGDAESIQTEYKDAADDR